MKLRAHQRVAALLLGVVGSLPGCSGNGSGTPPPGSDAANDVRMDGATDGDWSDVDGGNPPGTIPLVYTAEVDGTITVFRGTAANALQDLGELDRPGGIRFMTFNPSGTHLYAVNDSKVEGFSLPTDIPVYLGAATIAGQGTHLEVDHTGQWIIAVSFQGDVIQVLPIQGSGVPATPTQTFGGTASPNFCKRPHQVRIHPSNRWVYVPCRDSDYVVRFELNEDTGVLTSLGSVATPADTGPRHMDFHPSLNVAYVLGETSSHVIVYTLNPNTGALSQLQDVSTLPVGVSTGSQASDVHVTADGQFVYAVNRDTRHEIVRLQVASDGKLTRLGALGSQGTGARTFVLSPHMDWLVVGNTTSPNMATFSIDDTTGTLAHVTTYQPFASNVFYVGIRPQGN